MGKFHSKIKISDSMRWGVCVSSFDSSMECLEAHDGHETTVFAVYWACEWRRQCETFTCWIINNIKMFLMKRNSVRSAARERVHWDTRLLFFLGFFFIFSFHLRVWGSLDSRHLVWFIATMRNSIKTYQPDCKSHSSKETRCCLHEFHLIIFCGAPWRVWLRGEREKWNNSSFEIRNTGGEIWWRSKKKLKREYFVGEER